MEEADLKIHDEVSPLSIIFNHHLPPFNSNSTQHPEEHENLQDTPQFKQVTCLLSSPRCLSMPSHHVYSFRARFHCPFSKCPTQQGLQVQDIKGSPIYSLLSFFCILLHACHPLSIASSPFSFFPGLGLGCEPMASRAQGRPSSLHRALEQGTLNLTDAFF